MSNSKPLALVGVFLAVGGLYVVSNMSGEQRQSAANAISSNIPAIPELPSAQAQPNTAPPNFQVPELPALDEPSSTPSPEPAPQAQPKAVMVSASAGDANYTIWTPDGYSGSNFRSGPSVDYGVISDRIPEGAGVYLTGNWDGSWAETQYGNQTGWVFIP